MHFPVSRIHDLLFFCCWMCSLAAVCAVFQTGQREYAPRDAHLGQSLPLRMTMAQRRRQERDAELLREFGGDLGSCLQKHEGILEREKREAQQKQEVQLSLSSENPAMIQMQSISQADTEETENRSNAQIRSTARSQTQQRHSSQAAGMREEPWWRRIVGGEIESAKDVSTRNRQERTRERKKRRKKKRSGEGVHADFSRESDKSEAARRHTKDRQESGNVRWSESSRAHCA
jgi:hypothetical protein